MNLFAQPEPNGVSLSHDEIRDKFRAIKAQGFIKSVRKGDTGIGQTFEVSFGIRENNKKSADYKHYEVKSQRALSKSYVTLFTKSPSFPKGANKILRLEFGTPDEQFPDMKVFHTSFWADRKNTFAGKLQFQMRNVIAEERIYIDIYDMENKTLEFETYFTYADVKKGYEKLQFLFFVSANCKKDNEGIEYFEYTDAIVYTKTTFERFMEALDLGYIMFDFRVGVYKSGKLIGRHHDHGSGFRIKKEKLDFIYDEKFILN